MSRWSKTKRGALYSQLLTNPIAVTLSASLGILATAAINNAWGLELWNQWDLLDAIMTRYWSGTTRFAVFLVAFGWSVSILGTNIAANMIPFGNDCTLLLPRYLTIPRGQALVLCLGFAICPWKILASASVFTTFLAGYGLFLASAVAVSCLLHVSSCTICTSTVTNTVPADNASRLLPPHTRQCLPRLRLRPYIPQPALLLSPWLECPGANCLPVWSGSAVSWICRHTWCNRRPIGAEARVSLRGLKDFHI